MRDLRNEQNVLMVNLKISDHSADLDAGGTLILKYIKKMQREYMN